MKTAFMENFAEEDLNVSRMPSLAIPLKLIQGVGNIFLLMMNRAVSKKIRFFEKIGFLTELPILPLPLPMEIF
ncbi:MAG: hypothetical protein ABFS56_09990, partial [Pseudomonadota bacterium]